MKSQLTFDQTRDTGKSFEEELKDHLGTWGPHCGAPLSVYAGHLRILILSAQIDELKRLAQWISSEMDQGTLSSGEIVQCINRRCETLARMRVAGPNQSERRG